MARGLTRHFGEVRAVDGVDLEVAPGEVYGFLGPNGAGKSTTMMILTTLLRPTSGRALVAGFDVAGQPARVRESIGYVQQESAVDEFLTGRENLLFQARLSRIPRGRIAGRIDEMLSLVELEGRQHDAALAYSGGMRKRLDIAGGLLHMPRVLFLDEPTVGLDIQARRKIWDHVARIHREYGMTIFVSTHYMEEADALCGRVGIIDGGRIRAVGRPSEMKAALGGEVITLELAGGGAGRLAGALAGMGGVREASEKGGRITAYVSGGEEAIPRVFAMAAGMGLRISSISLKQPTLDDVFISHTGRELRDGGPPARPRRRGPRRGPA